MATVSHDCCYIFHWILFSIACDARNSNGDCVRGLDWIRCCGGCFDGHIVLQGGGWMETDFILKLNHRWGSRIEIIWMKKGRFSRPFTHSDVVSSAFNASALFCDTPLANLTII